jgi:hypothetical protein
VALFAAFGSSPADASYAEDLDSEDGDGDGIGGPEFALLSAQIGHAPGPGREHCTGVVPVPAGCDPCTGVNPQPEGC